MLLSKVKIGRQEKELLKELDSLFPSSNTGFFKKNLVYYRNAVAGLGLALEKFPHWVAALTGSAKVIVVISAIRMFSQIHLR